MKAAIFHGPGLPITIETVEMPRPGPLDVLVEVRRCGICGSDVSMTADAPFALPIGFIGHEFAGEIVAVGRDVTSAKVGQRVACLLSSSCGECDNCKSGPSGNALFCKAPKRPAEPGGGFGEYAAIRAESALVLPDSLSFADGALVEPMACGLHALRLADIHAGDTVLVLGAGSMALAVVYWARVLGAGRIVVASRSAHRREIAGAMGADGFHAFSTDDPDALTAALGRAPDIVAECVGKSGMLARAIDHVRPRGTVISLGMCMHAEPILPAAWSFKEAKLLFPLGYTADELIETVRTFDARGFQPDAMVSDVIALARLPAMIGEMRAGTRSGLKVQVDPCLEDS